MRYVLLNKVMLIVSISVDGFVLCHTTSLCMWGIYHADQLHILVETGQSMLTWSCFPRLRLSHPALVPVSMELSCWLMYSQQVMYWSQGSYWLYSLSYLSHYDWTDHCRQTGRNLKIHRIDSCIKTECFIISLFNIEVIKLVRGESTHAVQICLCNKMQL